MPTNINSAKKMSVGGAQGGKHWTAAEVEARQTAEETLKRRKRPTLKPPTWLSEEALAVWKDLKKKLRDVEMLDNLDAELMGMYCDVLAKYQTAARNLDISDTDAVKASQAWARLVLAYSEKLGLSPGARARLAKRKAEKVLDEFEQEFG